MVVCYLHSYQTSTRPVHLKQNRRFTNSESFLLSLYYHTIDDSFSFFIFPKEGLLGKYLHVIKYTGSKFK